MKNLRRVIAVAAIALAPCVARAGTTSVSFQSDANSTKRKLGSFQGTATYDDAAGLLTVVLQNTSAAGSGAMSLTGFAFDGADAGSLIYVDGDNTSTRGDEDAFDDLKSRKGVVKAKPFGKYHAGAGINHKWVVGRRHAAAGIAAGDSRTFVFDVDSTTALTAADFFSGNLDIVASFRGRRTDRVAGIATPVVPAPPVIPGDTNQTPGDGTDGGVIVNPPVNNGGDNGGGPVGGGTGNGNGGGPAAVPLPPAVWPALASLAALALPRLKRKLRGTL